ncbi:hypothetical protein BT93_J1757 [Corymbia citriodora subsp. variegata]|nr:hypothetical protein BT93_J1757 [Corymbia citriodora subsp. variegata]
MGRSSGDLATAFISPIKASEIPWFNTLKHPQLLVLRRETSQIDHRNLHSFSFPHLLLYFLGECLPLLSLSPVFIAVRGTCMICIIDVRGTFRVATGPSMLRQEGERHNPIEVLVLCCVADLQS